jgi:hypothetical protein
MYVAVFPHLKQWLSKRATDTLVQMKSRPEYKGQKGSEGSQTMQAAGARFLPQVKASSCLHSACPLLCAISEVLVCMMRFGTLFL